MKWLACLAVSMVFLGFAGAAVAADDPSGTWKWTVNFNDQEREVSLVLKLEGETLTGSMPGRGDRSTAIENGTYKDGEVSFSVTRERGDMKITSKYKGKVAGDTITGTIENERDGNVRSREWVAKKASSPPAPASGVRLSQPFEHPRPEREAAAEGAEAEAVSLGGGG